MKMTKPWTGKKNNLPSTVKKELHKERKTLAQIRHLIEDEDWEQQLQEYFGNQQRKSS